MRCFNQYQKGEITLTLALIGVVISVLGLGLGIASVQQEKSRTTSADEFAYESILEVRDEGGKVVDYVPGLRWQNNLDSAGSGTDLKDTNGKARLPFTTTSLSLAHRNRSSSVTIFPSTYKIVKTFCEDRQGTTCQNISTSEDLREIRNLVLAKDTKITYGWIVAGGTRPSVPTTVPATPTLTQSPIQIPTKPPVSSPTPLPTEDPFPFESTLSLLDSQTHEPVDWEPGMKFTTTVVATGQTFSGDIRAQDGTNKAVFHVKIPNIAPELRNQRTKVRIQIPPKYRVKIAYCGNVSGYGCDPIISEDKREIDNITIVKGAIVDYGFLIETDPIFACPLKAPACKPRNIRISEITPYSVRVNWDLPEDECEAYENGSNPFVIDITNNENKIVCSALTKGFSGVCTLGESTGRGVDHETDEWQQKRWKERGYTAAVYVEDTENQQCTSQAVSSGFTYVTQPNGCRHIEGNGTYRVVFTAHTGFADLEDFLLYARSGVGHTRATNLGDLYKKFTFVADTNLENDYQCKNNPDDSMNDPKIVCDGGVTDVKAKCNAHAAAILYKRAISTGYAYMFEDTNKMVLTTQTISAVPHEMGHAIADLYDEYIYDNDRGLKEEDVPDARGWNCTSKQDSKCTKWSRHPSALCKPGCTTSFWFRPSDVSVMGSHPLFYNRIWNLPSMDGWEAALRNFSTQTASKTSQGIDDLSLHVTLPLPSDGLLNTLDVERSAHMEAVNAYSQIPFTVPGSIPHYTIRVKDEHGKVLYQTEKPKILHKVIEEYGIVKEPLKEIDLYLPYFGTAYTIEVVDSESETAQVELQLSDFDIKTPQSSVHQKARADLDGNGLINGQDLTLLMSEGVYLVSDEGDINADGKTNALDYTLLLQWLGEERE